MFVSIDCTQKFIPNGRYGRRSDLPPSSLMNYYDYNNNNNNDDSSRLSNIAVHDRNNLNDLSLIQDDKNNLFNQINGQSRSMINDLINANANSKANQDQLLSSSLSFAESPNTLKQLWFYCLITISNNNNINEDKLILKQCMDSLPVINRMLLSSSTTKSMDLSDLPERQSLKQSKLLRPQRPQQQPQQKS